MDAPAQPDQKISEALAAALAAVSRKAAFLAVPALLAACVLIFYWAPLVSDSASIQWDAADVHYPVQKYFADRLRAGHLPFWTPYIYSGYPFLANPEAGAWYPLNWPFFLTGITPRAIQMELALNAFVACLGAYLFLAPLVRRREAAILGAFAYAFSGFFASHSSHVDVFMAAACFPWLLLIFRRARESVTWLRYAALGALAGGAMFLTGDFQGAVFAFAGLALYAAAGVWKEGWPWRPALAIGGLMLGGALAVYAIQGLPTAELASHAAPPPDYAPGSLSPKALLTAVYPNAVGTITKKDTGHVAEHYFYAGVLLLPLALLGALKSRVRRPALTMAIPAAIFALGPYGGVYSLTTLLPGGKLFGPPILDWFLVAFALAFLAAAGADWVLDRWGWRWRYAGIALAAVLFVDVWCWNSLFNPLAYAHDSYENLYGSRERFARQLLAEPQLSQTRFYSPAYVSGLGPMLHPLDLMFETTYGYFVLETGPYTEYLNAITRNAKLLDGLNVNRLLDVKSGEIFVNSAVLPRAYFPRTVVDAATPAASRKSLDTLDPSQAAVVLGPHPPVQQDPLASPFVVSADERSYRIHYQSATPGLMKLAVAWFPGWRASVGGRELPVLRVDHALMGVVAPEGEHDVEFEFHSTYFSAGMVITLIAVFILVALAWTDKAPRHDKSEGPYTLQRRGKREPSVV